MCHLCQRGAVISWKSVKDFYDNDFKIFGQICEAESENEGWVENGLGPI